MTRLAFILFAAGLFAVSAFAATVRVHPVADTTLFETTPTNNLGKVSSLAAGTTARSKRSRALIRFDLAGAVPSNAVITDATLTLSVVRAPASGGGVDSVFGLHRVLRAWVEGTKSAEANGSPATAGEATWLARGHPSNPWHQPGAAAPVDFVPDPGSERMVGGLGDYEFTGLATDIERWRANPATNFGWILISQDEVTQATARRFGSREDTNSPPELRIEFQMPLPPSPRLTDIQRLSGGIRFQFVAQPDVSYTVEHRAGITPGEWINLTNVSPASVPRNIVVADVPGATRRFYRVVAP
jgi:hypothetical protein